MALDDFEVEDVARWRLAQLILLVEEHVWDEPAYWMNFVLTVGTFATSDKYKHRSMAWIIAACCDVAIGDIYDAVG